MYPRFGPNRQSVIEIRDNYGDPIGRIARDTYISGQPNSPTPWVVYDGTDADAVDVGRFAHVTDARAFAKTHFPAREQR